MPTVDVLNIKKEKVGTLDLDDKLFATKVDPGLIHEAVIMQQASQRQGTASTKTRGKVRGGGRKPWKQKGTGRARAGSNRSPIWRGGGTTFGPQPRSYAYAFPKKKYRVALRSALSAKLRDGEVQVIENLDLPEVKTKHVAQILKNLELKGTVLFVHSERDENFIRAAGNIPWVRFLSVEALSIYELVAANNILFSKDSIEKIREVWS